MADYYQLLKQILAQAQDTTPAGRKDIYAKTYNALTARLKSNIPPVGESDIASEVQKFRDAVGRIEAETARGQATVASPDNLPQEQAIEPAPIASVTPTKGAQPSADPANPGDTGSIQKGASEVPASRPTAAVPAPAKRAIGDGDHEFLPAALEILETPPSPIRIKMMTTICVFVVAALAWSYFGHFDIVATAQGKLQPTGRINVVQPVENGKVRSLRVSNGSRVKEGDVLIEMDSTDAQADVNALSTLLGSLSAEVIRRNHFSAVIRSRQAGTNQKITWPPDLPEEARIREQRVFDADVAQLNSAISSLEAQRRQKMAEESRISSTIEAQEQFVRTLKERVDMRETLVARAAGARSNVIDALEKLNEQQTQLAIQRGQVKEAQASLIVLANEIEKTFQTADADNNQKLLQIQRQADDTDQRLAKARVRLSNATLKAPTTGTVQALSVLHTGQVVAAGEQVMRIVPDDVGLEIEGYIQNKDIGFIKEGQDAVIKVDSFPFTKYGTIDAKVVKIARDAIPLPEASLAEGNPAQSQRITGPGGTQRTQNLVYQVTLKPLQDKIGPKEDPVKLMPGMTVTLEVKTGRRRIITYLFTPLVEVGSAAMRER